MTGKNTGSKTIKKKKKKPSKMTPLNKLLCLIMLGASVFFFYETFSEIYSTIKLKDQLAEAQEKYQAVADENVYLTTERDKLTDPEYVQTYARGNYMLSKGGEQIFYLPEKSDE